LKNINKLNFFLLVLIYLTNTIFLYFFTEQDLIHSVFSQIFLSSILFWYLNVNLKKFSHQAIFIVFLFFLIKLFLIYIVIFFYWSPILKLNIGYDPIRYWIQSDNLILQGFNTDWISLNYAGILFYYAFIKITFGNNLLIVGLVNSIISTIAIVEILKIFIKNFGNFFEDTRLKYLVFVFLIPEVVFYESISARESIISTLYIFIYIFVYKFFFENKYILLNIILFLITFVLIISIRATMTIPIFLSVLTIAFLKGYKLQFKKNLIILFLSFIFLLLSDYVVTLFGGNSNSILSLFLSSFDQSKNIAGSGNFDLSNNSISNLLLPDNFFEAIIYLPIRMLMYLISPFPNFTYFFIEFITGDFTHLQNIYVIFSSILYIIAIPYLIMGFLYFFFKTTDNYNVQSIFIFYFFLIVAISGGNLILHDRYRAMSSILFFICSIIGFYKKDKLHFSKKLIFISWWLLLAFLSILYFLLKF